MPQDQAVPQSVFTRKRYESKKRYGNVNVSPTLFIGLGGSGKEVLMRLRRLFYTNMRHTGLPICEYLWIDTDSKVKDIKNQDYDKTSSKLYLPKTDMIDAQVSPATLDEYYRNPSKYNHIFEWLHPSLESLGPTAITDGVGMVRACGRLAFWSHYPEISRVIKKKLSDISDADRIKLTQDKKSGFGFDVDPRTKNVFLVASLAGGTGAGMLLDTAFVIKSIDPSVVVTGIFFLPSVFSKVISAGMQDITYANGYAALMELDYFMSPQVGVRLMTKDVYKKIIFKWGGEAVPVAAAPLHTIYLIGWKNRSHVQLSSYTEVFQMAAEAIHLEFCKSSFGDKKRSVKVGLAGFFINETLYESKDPAGKTIFCQYYPNRYSSFGISLIKLDIDRRRNAAAHYFARSLAEYWRQSVGNLDGIRTELDLALGVPDQPGKRWGHDEIQEYFLRYPDGDNAWKSVLTLYQDEIVKAFNRTRELIKSKFEQKTGAGAVNLSEGELGDLNREIKTDRNVSRWNVTVSDRLSGSKSVHINVLLKKIAEDWNNHISKGLQALDSNGLDMKRITENADVCLKTMQSAFLEKFHELLARPGDAPGRAGIRHASEFCRKYLERLDEIGQNFIQKPVPSRECSFTLLPFEASNELKKIMIYRVEGLALQAPLFRRTAVSWLNQSLEAKLKAQLDGFRDYLLQEVEETKMKVLEWYEVSYYNHVCTAAKQIFKNLREKIESCQEDLNHYEEGLKAIAENEEELLDSFNRDYHDIRHHLVELSYDDNWFNIEVTEALAGYYAASGATTWETLLEKESMAFFPRLLKPEDDQKKIKSEGFKRLFQVVCKRSSDVEKWRNLLNELETYCFGRLRNFLGSKNVDSEFQKTTADEKHRKIESICKAADVWISPSAVPCSPEEEDYIGVPSLQHKSTADQSIAEFPQFSNAQLFDHERGNMVFYREIAAFPLFHLEELWECRNHYYRMKDKMYELYQRHLDYRLIPTLRDVAPPKDQQEAVDLFDSGLLFIESIILGCCNVVPNQEVKSICIKMPRYEATEVTVLGASFGQVFRNLLSSPEHRQRLKAQIEKQKANLKKSSKNAMIEELALADYYVKKVFPPLQRAGFHGTNIFDTNFSLVCRELRARLIEDLVNRGDYTGPEDEALWDAVDKVDLEAVSVVFPFEEEDAQAELRVLKVP